MNSGSINNRNKIRGKTATGPRNQVRSTLSTANNMVYKKPAKTIQKNSNSKKAKRAEIASKRAHSQNNDRMKGISKLKTEESANMFDQIEKDTEDQLNEVNQVSDHNKTKSKENPSSNSIMAKDMDSLIKMAESKIKANADAMLQAQEAESKIDKKIKLLDELELVRDEIHQEDTNLQDHLDEDSKPMTRQERIANIVNELVAQDTELNKDIIEDSQSEEEELKSGVIEDQNTLMAFTDKPLEPIKEQATEEVQASCTEEGIMKLQGPDRGYDVDQIFDTQKKPSQSKLNKFIEETPIFGNPLEKEESKDPFQSFL